MEGPRAEVRVGTSPGTRRLIEFGRHADEHRNERGEGKPEVFNFLRFTHTCWRTRKTGRFIVKRKTIPKRLSAEFNYHALPGNMDSLNSFRAR
jgi:hypothetical protein